MVCESFWQWENELRVSEQVPRSYTPCYTMKKLFYKRRRENDQWDRGYR